MEKKLNGFQLFQVLQRCFCALLFLLNGCLFLFCRIQAAFCSKRREYRKKTAEQRQKHCHYSLISHILLHHAFKLTLPAFLRRFFAFEHRITPTTTLSDVCG